MGTQLPFPWSWADSVQRAYTAAVQLVTLDDVGGKLHLSPLHAVCICLITQFYMGYYSFIDSGRMKGWVGLVGWPIADSLPTKWSPVQLLAGAAGQRRSRTSVLPRCYTPPSIWCMLLKDELLIVLLVGYVSTVQYNDASNKTFSFSAQSAPPEHQKKVTLLLYFAEYMYTHLSAGGNIGLQQLHTDVDVRMRDTPVFMKNWFRTDRAVVMYLSNGTLQVWLDHRNVS